MNTTRKAQAGKNLTRFADDTTQVGLVIPSVVTSLHLQEETWTKKYKAGKI